VSCDLAPAILALFLFHIMAIVWIFCAKGTLMTISQTASRLRAAVTVAAVSVVVIEVDPTPWTVLGRI
jgi:hypothetical protein